jgi:hypothetical protein
MLRFFSLFILIIVQLLYLLALFPWYTVAQLSLRAFDPVNVGDEIEPWLFLGAILLSPLLPLVCSIAGWVNFRRRKYGWAIGWTLIPLLLVLALAGVILYFMADEFQIFERFALLFSLA